MVIAILTTNPRFRSWARQRQVLWFLDNLAALGALVGASSKNEDMAGLAMLAQASNFALQATPYYEWVRSAANVADAPSRGHPPPILDNYRVREVHLAIPWSLFLRPLVEGRIILSRLVVGSG